MISFIIPTFNSGKTIGRCLESVKKQRCGKEIIVVDGQSKDDTVKIVKRSGVRLLLDKGGRISTARNTGLKAARGGYVAFVDSDVVLPDGWAGSALELIEKHPDVAGVGGPGISPEKSMVSKSLNSLLYGKSPKEEMYVNSLATMDVLYRKNALDGMYFDETLETGEDPEFNLRLVKKGYRLAFSRKLWVWHHHPMKFGGLIRKWYNYGTNYPKMCSKHREFRNREYYLRMAFMPLLFSFIIASFFYSQFGLLALAQVSLLFFSYVKKGAEIGAESVIAFSLVHTVKQLSQLLGALVGLRKLV